MLNRRMGHRNPRALQQLADKDQSVVRFNRNIDSGDCEVCSAGNSKKSGHPPSDRTRAQTRLEIVHADAWVKRSVESYSGCRSAVMFTDDQSRMRWGFPIKSKDATAAGLHLAQEVADPAGLCIGKLHCDGGAEFKGRFQELCVLLGIIIETNAPYIAEGNAIAERGFGTIMGTTCRLLLGAPHLPRRLWAGAFKAAIYIKNRTPTDVVDGKAPLELWEDAPLGSMQYIHEWGPLAFNHKGARLRPNNLAARAKKMHLVGYDTKRRSYTLWDPAEPLKITNSAEVSFREKETRDK